MPPAIATKEIHRASLWFGLLGGGFAWTFHLISAYVVAEFGCVGGLAEHHFLGISLVAWLGFALTLVTVVIAAASAGVSYRRYRQLQPLATPREPFTAEIAMARIGYFTSALFLIVILFESIPIFFYLSDC